MSLVKANMAFYHDAVGTRAHNEVFEVKNQEVCGQLEKAGYVSKVSAEEEQMHQERLQQQETAGQAAMKANERISLANHEHNVQANQHTQKVAQMRKGTAQSVQPDQAQAEQNQEMQAQPEQPQAAQAQATSRAKKADK